jgi:flagellar assembly protein FliH
MSCRATVRRDPSAGRPIAWPAGDETPSLAAGEIPTQPAPDGAHPAEPNLREERNAGFREGEAAARAVAQAEMRTVGERLARTLEELAALRPRLREQAEEDLIRLAVAIARRVVRRELTVDPQAIAGLVKAALEQLASQEAVGVRVHPGDEAAVLVCLEDAGCAALAVTADPSLERGSAVFQTARGDVDASVAAQLAEIERGLTDRFRSSR